jgi:acyl-CoA thioesterase I
VNRRTLLGGAVATGATLAVGRAARAALQSCAAPAELLEVDARLPHLAARLRARQPVTIVAIGGASTRGAAAGVPDNAYPHRLQLALARGFPGRRVAVINKGVPRQTAEEMLARFPADVFAAKPVLVVWEVGIVDAVRGIELDDFAAALEAGIDQLKKRAIDSILVDMQFSQKTNAVIDFERYLDTVHRVGDLNEVYVFPRYALMRFWSEQHMFDLDAVSGSERVRLAANVYDCIGRRLAEAIGRAAR